MARTFKPALAGQGWIFLYGGFRVPYKRDKNVPGAKLQVAVAYLKL